MDRKRADQRRKHVDHVGSLQIEHDLEHQRRAWTWRRIGWAGISLVLLAALAGVFGPPGPLATATAGEPGSPLWVEHPRFVRMSRPMELAVHLGGGGPAPRIWLDERLLTALDVDHLTPPPASATAAAGRTVFEIATAAAPGGAARVVLAAEALSPGVVDGRIGLEGGPSVRVRLLVYP